MSGPVASGPEQSFLADPDRSRSMGPVVRRDPLPLPGPALSLLFSACFCRRSHSRPNREWRFLTRRCLDLRRFRLSHLAIALLLAFSHDFRPSQRRRLWRVWRPSEGRWGEPRCLQQTLQRMTLARIGGGWCGRTCVGPGSGPDQSSEIARPLKSALAMRPYCWPLSSSTTPFWLVRIMVRAPAPTAMPAPAAT